jgi:hypothetical protein
MVAVIRFARFRPESRDAARFIEDVRGDELIDFSSSSIVVSSDGADSLSPPPHPAATNAKAIPRSASQRIDATLRRFAQERLKSRHENAGGAASGSVAALSLASHWPAPPATKDLPRDSGDQRISKAPRDGRPIGTAMKNFCRSSRRARRSARGARAAEARPRRSLTRHVIALTQPGAAWRPSC